MNSRICMHAVLRCVKRCRAAATSSYMFQVLMRPKSIAHVHESRSTTYIHAGNDHVSKSCATGQRPSSFLRHPFARPASSLHRSRVVEGRHGHTHPPCTKAYIHPHYVAAPRPAFTCKNSAAFMHQAPALPEIPLRGREHLMRSGLIYKPVDEATWLTQCQHLSIAWCTHPCPLWTRE